MAMTEDERAAWEVLNDKWRYTNEDDMPETIWLTPTGLAELQTKEDVGMTKSGWIVIVVAALVLVGSTAVLTMCGLQLYIAGAV